ncbi:MAG: hypothetical protein HYU58_06760 [Proteobacteria bacterium]|nr:hypothetical protein [Pseudomonadota bacterium]
MPSELPPGPIFADGLVTEPFRILPSRDEDQFWSWIVMLAGPVTAIAGFFYSTALTDRLISGLIGCLLTAYGSFNFVRERRNFGPGARYHMLVDLDALRMATPEGAAAWPWADLAPFAVTEFIVADPNHPPRHEDPRTFTKRAYRLTAHRMSNGEELAIDLTGFAGNLGTPGKERAEIMCAVMNELRRRNAVQGAENKDQLPRDPYVVPRGLRVMPR